MTHPDKQRLDQWLFHARLFKTRTLASTRCKGSKIRVDGGISNKAGMLIHPGQVLTFQRGGRIRVIKILELAKRRGPASEAINLYEDLTPEQTRLKTRGPFSYPPSRNGMRETGTGRPTKKDRRAVDRLKKS